MQYVFVITPEGKLPQAIKETLARVIPQYAGKTVRLELDEYQPTSSDKQRAYYCAVIVPVWMKILHETQHEYYDEDDTHDYLMEEVGQFFKPLKKGQKRPSRRSYTKLTKAETENFHTLCRAKAAKEGYDIPEPNER